MHWQAIRNLQQLTAEKLVLHGDPPVELSEPSSSTPVDLHYPIVVYHLPFKELLIRTIDYNCATACPDGLINGVVRLTDDLQRLLLVIRSTEPVFRSLRRSLFAAFIE